MNEKPNSLIKKLKNAALLGVAVPVFYGPFVALACLFVRDMFIGPVRADRQPKERYIISRLADRDNNGIVTKSELNALWIENNGYSFDAYCNTRSKTRGSWLNPAEYHALLRDAEEHKAILRNNKEAAKEFAKGIERLNSRQIYDRTLRGAYKF